MSEAELLKTIAPAVEAKRGYGARISAVKRKDGNWIAYCNGRSVVVRNLEDPTKCQIFSEHKAQVKVARFNPTGTQIASGDADGTVILWEVDKFGYVKSRYEINQGVNDIAWSDDSKRVVACGAGDALKAKVFMADTGNTLGDLIGHTKTLLSCDFRQQRPYRIVTCGEDYGVGLYSGPPFSLTTMQTPHANYANCVRFSPNGDHFVTVGADQKIFLFDGKTGAQVKEIVEDKKNKHQGSIYEVSWSPDSKHILTASGDKTCKQWSVDEGKVVKTFRFGVDVKKPELNDMQVSCLWHGEYMISVSLSGAINFLDGDNPDQPKLILNGCMDNIKSFAVDGKANRVYTGEVSGQITAWDMKNFTGRWFSGKAIGKNCASLSVDANGALVSATFDDRMRVNTNDSYSADAIPLNGNPTELTMAHNTAGLAACIQGNNNVVIVKDGKVTATLALGFTPTCCTFSHDDAHLWIGGKNRKLNSYNVTSSGQITAGNVSVDVNDVPTTICASPDGANLVVIDKSKSINYFGLDGKDLNTDKLMYHQAAIQCAAYSPSGDKLATGGADEVVYIWYDTKQYTSKRLKIQAHAQGVLHVGWLDNDTVVSVGDDRSIKVWRVPAL